MTKMKTDTNALPVCGEGIFACKNPRLTAGISGRREIELIEIASFIAVSCALPGCLQQSISDLLYILYTIFYEM